MDSEEKKYTAKDLYIAFIVGGIFQRSQAGTLAEARGKAVDKGKNAARTKRMFPTSRGNSMLRWKLPASNSSVSQ